MFEFFDYIVDFLSSGIYDLVVEAFAYLVQVATLFSIKFTIISSQFAWDVAQQILQDLGVSDALNAAWGTLDTTMLNTLTFFGIPEGVNSILSAFVTKYVLRFIPFAR